jgi:hypothetical protein
LEGAGGVVVREGESHGVLDGMYYGTYKQRYF